MEIIVNAIAFLCTFGALTWGGRLFLRSKKALYLQMIILAVGCMAISRLFDLVVNICVTSYPKNFEIDLLGVLGCFAFFFAANYGQMDSLVDDGSKKITRYRLIPLVAMVFTLTAVILVFRSGYGVFLKAEYLIVNCMIGHAMYYNLKHFLIPDVDYGFVRCFRRYNAVAFGIGILYLCETVLEAYELTLPSYAVKLFISFLFIAVVPALKRGVKLWTT